MTVESWQAEISRDGSNRPSIPGDYAVALMLNACADTSACYPIPLSTAVTEPSADAGTWSVSPNPSRGRFTLSSPSPSVFELLDGTGRCIATYTLTGPSLDVRETLPAGLYLLRERGTGITRKIVME